MKFKYLLIVVFCYVVFLSILNIYTKPNDYNVHNEQHYKVLTTLLGNYTRPITILEIGVDAVFYTRAIADHYDSTNIVLLLHKLCSGEHRKIEQEYDNVVLLNPRRMTLEKLRTLGRCEHFDVVIMHGIPSGLKTDHVLQQEWRTTIDLVLALGDFVFIEIPANASLYKTYLEYKKGHSVSVSKTVLYRFDMQKKGLDIARWNLAHMPSESQPRYPIMSNFHEKIYYKKDVPQGTPWLKGINLLTFLMLGGISPCEELIARDIEAMRSTKHNDLIIGNMIIQGNKVIPIDLNDPRWNGNLEKCVNSALAVFKGDYTRLKSPEGALAHYRSLMAKKGKKTIKK